MINKLATEFKGNIDCLGENTEKYKTFEVSPKKIKESNKLITHKLKFIDFTMNKIKAQCAFIKLNNNRLIYKCKKCDDKSY